MASAGNARSHPFSEAKFDWSQFHQTNIMRWNLIPSFEKHEKYILDYTKHLRRSGDDHQKRGRSSGAIAFRVYVDPPFQSMDAHILSGVEYQSTKHYYCPARTSEPRPLSPEHWRLPSVYGDLACRLSFCHRCLACIRLCRS